MKRVLFITDPWETLEHSRDTSLRLAQAAHATGAEVYWTSHLSLRLENAVVRLDAYPFKEFGSRAREEIQFGPTSLTGPETFKQIHYRVDPPVNEAYLQPLLLLRTGVHAASKKIEVVNPLRVLLKFNEKIAASALPKLTPAQLISSQWDNLLVFGASRAQVVLKPIHQAQSKGVELLDFSTASGLDRARAALETATGGFKVPVLLQEFFPEIQDGELRLWYLDGRLLASVRKRPLPENFKIDIDRGSSIEVTTLSRKDERASEKISALLKREKIRLAAVDLIAGKITDLNFTSPGLLVEMEQLYGEDFASRIMKKLLR